VVSESNCGADLMRHHWGLTSLTIVAHKTSIAVEHASFPALSAPLN
jgi:hypothetical protein